MTYCRSYISPDPGTSAEQTSVPLPVPCCYHPGPSGKSTGHPNFLYQHGWPPSTPRLNAEWPWFTGWSFSCTWIHCIETQVPRMVCCSLYLQQPLPTQISNHTPGSAMVSPSLPTSPVAVLALDQLHTNYT